MKCLSPFEMDNYILSTSSGDIQQIDEHIATCYRCRKLYSQQLEEQVHWSHELYTEALSDSFTAQVMDSLEQEELEHTVTNDANETSNVLAGRSRIKRKGRSLRKLLVGAATMFFVLSSVIVYSVPTLAETVRSLFVKDNMDIGLLRAQEFGLVENPNVIVEDKGYTLKINEAVADPTRVIVALQLLGPDGKHDTKRLVFHEGNSVEIKNAEGEVVGELHKMSLTEDFYYMIANFSEPLHTDSITIEGHITELGSERKKIPILKGDWNFSFSIDMKEANQITTSTPLAGTYTSPEGLTVTLKKLTRMVQGVRFEFDTELSEEALARSPGELWKRQGLRFHFEDSLGEEIHSVNARKLPRKDSVMSWSNVPGDRPGLMHWSYTFKYLPLDTPYIFVLDGYYISENDGSMLQFEPSMLKELPVLFDFGGDELMLNNFTLEPTFNTLENKAEGTLHLDGEMWNEQMGSQWMLKIPNGDEYKVIEEGIYSPKGSGWKDGYLVYSQNSLKFTAEGLTQIPAQLQIIRTVVSRVYTNVNWSVPLKGDHNVDLE